MNAAARRPLRIALIAPSSRPDAQAVARGVARLRALGHVVLGEACAMRHDQRFAGTDAERLAELAAIASLPDDVDVVMALRGGYGLSRLLGRIDFDALCARLRRRPLALVGHSDFTALQLALLKRGCGSLAGPMLCPDFGAETLDATMLAGFDAAFAPALRVEWAARSATADARARLEVDGMLWGGNLAMLCSLIGTPHLPAVEGGILFVEDVNEHPYRIERMLMQLAHAGILARQRAVLVGDMSGYRVAAHDHGYDLPDALAHIGRVAGLPVITGLPFGHIPGKLTLPVGAHARFAFDGTRAVLRTSGWPAPLVTG